MWDFGRVDLLEPEAIGDPGRRAFRLRVMSRGEAASLWLEKEQLAALTLAIRQLLEQTEDDDGDAGDQPAGLQSRFPEQPTVDFKLGKLGIGYDESQRIVTIFAYDMEAGDDASPTFSCQVTRSQCRAFADQADETITAGRPLCVVCGGPIDRAGHKCQRRNGHSDVQISLQEEEKEE